MKKTILLAITFAIMINLAYASTVDRTMPQRVDPNSNFEVTLAAHNLQLYKLFTIEDAVPDGFIVTEWQIDGVMETKKDIATRFVDNKYGWSFTAANESVTITYQVTAPAANGSYLFEAVWFDAQGHGKNLSNILVNIVSCGDGICEVDEDCESCFVDCACQGAERCVNKVCGHYCGNDICEDDENSISCLDDCPLAEEQIMQLFGVKEDKKIPLWMFISIAAAVLVLLAIAIVILKKPKS